MKNYFLNNKTVKFKGDKKPYNIMAVSDNFAIASRRICRRADADLIWHQVDMNAYSTFTDALNHLKDGLVYSIVSFKDGVRSTDNWILGIYDYSNVDDCKKALVDLENGEMELSERNKVCLEIE